MSIKASDASLNPRRYGAYLICAAVLALELFLINALLSATVGPLSSPDKRYVLDKNLIDMVAGKGQQVATRHAKVPEPLILALGASSIRLSLDSDRLRERSGVPWLNLGVLGASFVTMRDHLDPLWRRGLKADVVVLGVHSLWMGRDPSFRDSPDSYDPRGLLWLTRNRAPIAAQAGRALLLARSRFGLSAWPSELWDTKQKFFATVPPELLEYELEWARSRGHFGAQFYESTNSEATALLQILGNLKQLGVPRVLLVDLPLHSQLRRRTPERASELLRWCVAQAAVPGLETYDLRQSIADSDFVDYFHVNPDGELKLSDALADLVSEAQSTKLEGGSKPRKSSR